MTVANTVAVPVAVVLVPDAVAVEVTVGAEAVTMVAIIPVLAVMTVVDRLGSTYTGRGAT